MRLDICFLNLPSGSTLACNDIPDLPDPGSRQPRANLTSLTSDDSIAFLQLNRIHPRPSLRPPRCAFTTASRPYAYISHPFANEQKFHRTTREVQVPTFLVRRPPSQELTGAETHGVWLQRQSIAGITTIVFGLNRGVDCTRSLSWALLCRRQPHVTISLGPPKPILIVEALSAFESRIIKGPALMRPLSSTDSTKIWQFSLSYKLDTARENHRKI